jgi:hypothetical protein
VKHLAPAPSSNIPQQCLQCFSSNWKYMIKIKMHNDLCWCFSVAASGVWEFPPQGLNSRLKSWGSCTHPQSYSKRLKVGHNRGLLLLTHANW